MMFGKKLSCALLAAGALAMSGLNAQADDFVVFEADFETDQSALFELLVIDSAANTEITDYVVDWQFDYQAYDHTNLFFEQIPHAPNSQEGDSKALLLNMNLVSGTNMGLNLLPILGEDFRPNSYSLQFDLYSSWDVYGGSPGGTSHPMWASFGSNGGSRAIYGQSGAAAFTPKGNGTVFGIAPRQTTSNYVYYDGNGSIFNYNPNQPGWGGVNNNVEPWITLFPEREIYEGFILAGEPSHIWITIELQVVGNRMFLYMTPDREGGVRTLVSNPAGFTTVNAGADLGNPYIGISDFFNTIQQPDDFFLFDNLRVTNLPFPPTEPTITLLDDNPTTVPAVSFGVSFDKSVPSFGASNVALTGDLPGTIAVGGVDPDYVVIVKLDSATTEGTVGIELLENFSDFEGIEYEGANSASDLYTYNVAPPGGFNPDYNGDGLVNVADVTAFAQDVADGVYSDF